MERYQPLAATPIRRMVVAAGGGWARLACGASRSAAWLGRVRGMNMRKGLGVLATLSVVLSVVTHGDVAGADECVVCECVVQRWV